MREMFQIIKRKITQGESLVLVSIIASSGSAPRGVGARMLVGAEGRLCGTIGGGAVEYRSEQIAARLLLDRSSAQYEFSLTKDDIQSLGMICGGEVTVYFTYLDGNDNDVALLSEEAERRYLKPQDLWLISDLSHGGKLGLFSFDYGLFGLEFEYGFELLLSKSPVRKNICGCDLYMEQIHNSGCVYVFGCGHVAQELEPVLTHLGFRCVMLDDRSEFADKQLFPTAYEVKLIDFEHVADAVEIGEDDYACVMTRGHVYDTIVQAQVLRTAARYIGVIGSRKKKEGVFRILREQGFTDNDLDRITTPIGTEICAQTPAEIAISVAGQLIECRANS